MELGEIVTLVEDHKGPLESAKVSKKQQGEQKATSEVGKMWSSSHRLKKKKTKKTSLVWNEEDVV